MSDGVLQALQDAGRRCDRYQVQHIVTLDWRIASSGLELTGHHGADSVRRLVSWFEIERAANLNDLLLRSETAVLRGLSS